MTEQDFILPGASLLKDSTSMVSENNQSKIEANKIKLVNALNEFDIEIDKIKATVGPTVTMYEIVPAAGTKVSKIMNLQDDLAMSLSASGIRILAPIPGKNFIGIEVPNEVSEIVSLKELMESPEFENSTADLPIAFGKTIDNKVFIADLAKMPHLLVAGATGQGKSVGLNVALISLLYKKGPSELKLVLVDPKKVDLSIFNSIAKQYMMTLGGSNSIITDTSKAVSAMKQLCNEMDNRYKLLEASHARNIKEYNAKNTGVKLPYIVVAIDEYADLIMTAGKDIEAPITRLAQLARAVGIHLIIATQRPSVNVITGSIKANFPARISFKVASKVDSRTILDQSGAEQLIGRGDMLVSLNSTVKRVQCAFISDEEIVNVINHITSQDVHQDPVVAPITVNIQRDDLFEEAKKVVIQAKHATASLLQRKLKINYNRAATIIDQLEAAGIVGPYHEAKPREVLVTK